MYLLTVECCASLPFISFLQRSVEIIPIKRKKREKRKKKEKKKSLTTSLLRVCNSSAFNSVTNNIPVPSYTKLIHYPSFKKILEWLKIH